jgi:hypothetical protein
MLADLALICAWFTSGPPLLMLPTPWQPLPVAQRVVMSGITLAAKVGLGATQDDGSTGGLFDGGLLPEFLLQLERVAKTIIMQQPIVAISFGVMSNYFFEVENSTDSGAFGLRLKVKIV